MLDLNFVIESVSFLQVLKKSGNFETEQRCRLFQISQLIFTLRFFSRFLKNPKICQQNGHFLPHFWNVFFTIFLAQCVGVKWRIFYTAPFLFQTHFSLFLLSVIHLDFSNEETCEDRKFKLSWLTETNFKLLNGSDFVLSSQIIIIQKNRFVVLLSFHFSQKAANALLAGPGLILLLSKWAFHDFDRWFCVGLNALLLCFYHQQDVIWCSVVAPYFNSINLSFLLSYVKKKLCISKIQWIKKCFKTFGS